jgi:hypothetical protein
MSDNSGTLSAISNLTGFAGDVEKNKLVQVFDEKGNEFFVTGDKVDNLVSQGYRLAPLDPEATAAELLAFMDSAKLAVANFMDGVIVDRVVDPSDQSNFTNAVFAMKKVAETWQGFMSDIFKTFPVIQGAGVILKDADGNEVEVDPGQVELYKSEKGFTE